MRPARLNRATLPLATTLLLIVASSPAAAAAATPTLPPALIAQHEARIAAAERDLTDVRSNLADAALAQREAVGAAGRLDARAELITGVATLGPLAVPPAIQSTLDAAQRRATEDVKTADGSLAKVTDTAAAAQAVLLDETRRLRALKRASATEDDRDTTLGSWRFGSGGQAVSAASIDQYLASKGSPLAGQGAAFLESGVEHEVDPRLVVAIAGAESYFGIITCAPHNAWGWGCPNGPYRFDSWAQAIDTITLGLKENYIDGGRTTVGEIHLKYAPPDAANDPTDLNYAWPNNVAKFLVEQGGDPQSVAGVLGPSR